MVEAGEPGTAAPEAGARVPEALLRAVIETFDPQQVILFGSCARGDAHEDSGRDLLVVVDDDAPDEKVRARRGHEAARRAKVIADVIPCRRSIFEEKRDVVGSLAWTAEQEGRAVYERGRA